MAVLCNNVIAGASIADDAAGGVYQIEKSLRFNSADSAYLSRTFGLGNRRTFTWAGWVKRNKLGATQSLFNCHPSSNDKAYFHLHSEDKLGHNSYHSSTWWNGSTERSPELLRDPSAWMHVVFVMDTTNSEPDDRYRYYVNGKRLTHPGGDYGLNILNTLNTAVQHNIGGNYNDSNYGDFYLADVQFIDGLALSPAAFGKWDAANCWQPKAFALPQVNDGTNWSNLGGGVEDTNSEWEKCFTGATDPGDGLPNTRASSGNQITWVPNKDITADHEILLSLWTWFPNGELPDDDCLIINGENHGHRARQGMTHNTWSYYSIPSRKIDSTNGLVLKNKDGSTNRFQIDHILVDGVVLQDSTIDPETRNNPNNGTNWTSTVVRTGSVTEANIDDAFDGSLDTVMVWGADNDTFTFKPGLTGLKKIRIFFHEIGSSSAVFKLNNVDYTSSVTSNGAAKWWTAPSTVTAIDSTHGIYFNRVSNSDEFRIKAIEVDGHILIDSTYDNSFHLKFNDTSTNARLGRDFLNNKGIEDSSVNGALPIYNTTADSDGYDPGETKGSGYRTDSNAAGLKLAIPGDVLTDEHDHVTNATGSAVSITANGSIAVSTDQSRFYGSSIRFDGSDDYLYIAPPPFTISDRSTTYTVEAWVYCDSSVFSDNTYRSLFNAGGFHIGFYRSGATDSGSKIFAESDGNWNGFGMVSTNPCPKETWFHLAFVRNGTSQKLYVNGVESASDTTSDTQTAETNWKIGSAASVNNWKGYVSDLKVYDTAIYTANFTPPTRNDFTVNNLVAPYPVVKTADATGAKPVLVTTGDFGGGTTDAANTDSDASDLLICLSGKSLTEVEPSGRTAATRTWTAYGDAAVSTNSSRFYGSSFKFDGSGDYISAADSTDFDMGTNSFTIEAWINPANLSHHGVIAGQWHDGTSSNCAYSLQIVNGKPRLVTGDNPNLYSCISDDNIVAGEWTHIAGVYDGSTNTSRLYVNGILKKTLASHSSCNNGGPDFHLGAAYNASGRNTLFNGYIQDVRVYKGLVKYTSNFTVTNEGTSKADDALNDSPTNYTDDSDVAHGNYCTLNPLTQANNSGTQTFKEGNLYHESTSSAGAWHMFRGTMTIPKGSTDKFYYEVEWAQDTGDTDFQVGWVDPFQKGITASGFGDSPHEYCFRGDNGKKFNNNTQTTYGNAPSQGDIVGVGYDNGSIRFWVNGTEQNSGTAAWTGIDKPLMPGFATYTQSNAVFKAYFNFGQRPFKHPQTDYKSICTQNLDDTFSGDEVNNPSKYFDVLNYTGTAAVNTIKGLNFQPELIWIKNHAGSTSHSIYDKVRGEGSNGYYRIESDTSDAQADEANLTAINSDGFTLTSAGGYTNGDGANYTAWCWDVGTAGSTSNNAANSNNATIACDYMVNQTAGFSIAKYTGTDDGSGTENSEYVYHGLNASPDFVIVKGLGAGRSWIVKHKDDDANENLFLDDTHAGTTWGSGYIGNLHATNSNNINRFNQKQSYDPTNLMADGEDYIMYSWTPIAGYSAFGKYTGNGSDAGPFIYTGFKPRYLMLKTSSTTSSWTILDSARESGNPTGDALFADGDWAEIADRNCDLLSNGFKVRDSDGGFNGSNATIVYACFAEHPFKTARAA